MDRLAAQDLITFWPELRGWPQDVGALAVFEGEGLLDERGELELAAVRATIESRLPRVARFRQILYVPKLGLGRPLWVDAPSFDIDQHVQVARAPAPGEQAQVIAVVEQLRLRPLARSRPLWQVWLLTGLPGRRVGFYLRVHHAVADGPAALAMLGALLDPEEGARREQALPWTPRAAPTARALFADTWQRRWAGLTRGLTSAAAWAARPHHPRAAWRQARTALAEMRVPRGGLNRVVGTQRRLVLIRTGLDPVKDIAHGHQATVNDVLLTAVAGGVRALLVCRGEAVVGVQPQAMVPVSLRAGRGGGSPGNQLGSMIVPLPVGEPDPVAMLRQLAADTSQRKPRTRSRRSPVLRSTLLQRAAMALLTRQQVYHVYLADVPGPRKPLSLMGARMIELFPVVAIMGNLTIGVGALSFAGQLNITVVADPAACPDVDVLANGLRDTLRALGAPVDVESRW